MLAEVFARETCPGSCFDAHLNLLQEYNDVLLTSYLSTMTKGLQSLNEVSSSPSIFPEKKNPDADADAGLKTKFDSFLQLVDKFDLVASGNDDNKPQRGKGSRDRPAFAMPGF